MAGTGGGWVSPISEAAAPALAAPRCSPPSAAGNSILAGAVGHTAARRGQAGELLARVQSPMYVKYPLQRSSSYHRKRRRAVPESFATTKLGQ